MSSAHHLEIVGGVRWMLDIAVVVTYDAAAAWSLAGPPRGFWPKLYHVSNCPQVSATNLAHIKHISY